MKTYIPRSDTVEATRWYKHGDHPKVEKRLIRVGGIQTKYCIFCRVLMELHGCLKHVIVCPGDWIVDGESVYSDDTFQEDYMEYDGDII